MNGLRSGQNDQHFVDIFLCIFFNEKVLISFTISLKFVLEGFIDKKSSMVQVMAWRLTGNKPLYEPVLSQFIDAYAALGHNKLIAHFSHSCIPADTATDAADTGGGRQAGGHPRDGAARQPSQHSHHRQCHVISSVPDFTTRYV